MNRFRPCLSLKTLFILALTATVVSITAATYFFVQWRRLENELRLRSAKSKSSISNAEFLIRAVDFYYTVDFRNGSSGRKNLSDFFSAKLVNSLDQSFQESLKRFIGSKGQQSATIHKILREKDTREMTVFVEIVQRSEGRPEKKFWVEIRAAIGFDDEENRNVERSVISKWQQTILDSVPAEISSPFVKVSAESSVSLRFPCEIVSINQVKNIKQQLNPRFREVQLFSSEDLVGETKLPANCESKRFAIELITDKSQDTLYWLISDAQALKPMPRLSEQDLIEKALKEQLGFEIKKTK